MFSNSFARVLIVAAASFSAVSCFEVAKTDPQAAAPAAVEKTEFARTPGANWSAYASDFARTKYSPLDQINAGNVKNAKVVWRWASPDAEILKADPKLFTMYNESSPIAIDGFLYVSTQLGQVAKIDGDTGATVWVYDPKSYSWGEIPPNLGFVHRGVTYWESADGAVKRVFIGTPDAFLVSLDATTGALDKDFGVGGRVDLLKGLARDGSDWKNRWQYAVSSPVTICKDTIIVGASVADIVETKENPPGDVRAFNVRSGKLAWSFRTVPAPGQVGYETWAAGSAEVTGNTNVWSVMSADLDLGLVYLPTTTPSNDYYGGERAGDNLFAESLVCLDCATGLRKWHYQFVHHGLWDYDVPASPNLMDIEVDGKKIKAVAQVTKQAFTFVFNRETGEPIWPIVETPVALSLVEDSAPTQPIPSKPLPFDRQGVTDDSLIDFPLFPELRAEAIALVDQYVRGPLYTPPLDQKKGLLFLPGTTGGANWAGAAFHPEKQKLYIPSITKPSVTVIEKAPPMADGSTPPFAYRHVMLKSSFTTPEGKPVAQPVFKPPYGRVTAIDMKTGEHAWMVPMGRGPKNDPRIAQAIKGTEWENKDMGWDRRSQIMLTKNLVFVGQTGAASVVGISERAHALKLAILSETREEQVLKVLDPDTGSLVHEIDLTEGTVPSTTGEPAPSGNTYGAPMTYLNKKGRQVIVVPVGGANRRAEFVGIEVK